MLAVIASLRREHHRPRLDDLFALQQRVDRFEALIDRAEALSAIKRLQHAYAAQANLFSKRLSIWRCVVRLTNEAKVQ